ncbi:MAG: hypothetical protein B6229_05940 [Spirochaetaceae bacterium 4572_7]|nr:MAG: hypothetical protein B6229_05940 [Spirochaetaceae bacterium 4572_7]
MYNFIDNKDNQVIGVYSGFTINLTYGGDTTYPSPINCEHTIPQSFFNKLEPMKSDLHHLFPVYGNWNSIRNNYKFGDIEDSKTTTWIYLDKKQNDIPNNDVINLFSEYYNKIFEPREDHKGNVARAIFYFYTMYPTEAGNIDDVGNIDTLYKWHLNDPVDQDEKERNRLIGNYQGNRNPYIDFPDAVAIAFDLIN